MLRINTTKSIVVTYIRGFLSPQRSGSGGEAALEIAPSVGETVTVPTIVQD